MTRYLQDLFPQDSDLLYLNHAAVSPWPDTTRQAVLDFATQNVSRGSLGYPDWLIKEQTLKEQIATLINAAHWQDIALQKNTSEALSVVAYGINWESGDNIVSIRQEFPSNRIVWESLVQSKGIEFRLVDIPNDTESIEEQLMATCDSQTRLMSISAVQFASGLRHDLNTLGRFCRDRGILFCVDAIQAVGATQFDVIANNIDFAMADGHKWMMGPEGLGFLYVRPDLRESISLLQYGWHMTDDPSNYDRLEWAPASDARRFECGSPNMLGIHALSASLEVLLELGMPKVEQAISERINLFKDFFGSNSNYTIHSPMQSSRCAGIINFSHNRIDSKILFEQLLQQQVFCALRGAGIRLSPHFYTPLEKIERAITIIEDVVTK